MVVLAGLLFITHVIYFRADGGSISSAVNILKGLNSNTFNYLQANSIKNLALDRSIRKWDINKNNVTSVMFFSQCVKFNKPCVFNNLATTWPAFTKWNDAEYMSTLIGASEIIQAYHSSGDLYSFQPANLMELTYSQFEERK